MSRTVTVNDWTGRGVPPPTGPEDVYPVWSVETKPAFSRHDVYVNRGWQDFLSFLGDHIETILDGLDEDDARAGVTFTVKLIDMMHEDFPAYDSQEAR